MKKNKIQRGIIYFIILSVIVFILYLLKIKSERHLIKFEKSYSGLFIKNELNVNYIDSIKVYNFFWDKYAVKLLHSDQQKIIIRTKISQRDIVDISNLSLIIINNDDTLKMNYYKHEKNISGEYIISWINYNEIELFDFYSCDVSMLGASKLYHFIKNSRIVTSENIAIGLDQNTVLQSNIRSCYLMKIDETIGYNLIYGLLYNKNKCVELVEVSEFD
ncbi:hypothetical protein EI427_21620 [Flammeovirga pectinis]|uniref:Uncharacterized protein n=1 Tax=Flammeovirga pectinis TaxID=2494373 RepID=A0A3Q9FRP0_9BACT|nr:hypothetical protein [Flammeovirga pectinis]AZQ64827.1 hypothetical protein EI427_21620 [Flammeovirga pectinis]